MNRIKIQKGIVWRVEKGERVPVTSLDEALDFLAKCCGGNSCCGFSTQRDVATGELVYIWYKNGVRHEGTKEEYKASAGDIVPPTITTATVNGDVMVLTFSEPISGTPAASAFSVSPTKTISTVVVSGSTVTLTLSTPYVDTDVVQVSYTVPASNYLHDGQDNKVASFTNQTVTNNTPE